jgi:nicotinamidase-related amidase
MDHLRILLDIETQVDFFRRGYFADDPGLVARRVRKLFEWARRDAIPVISTVLRVRPGEAGPIGDRPCCVEGTRGERKLPGTVLPSRIDLGLRNTTDLPLDIFDRYQQVVIEKRHTDIFGHARAERLISELGPATFIICGSGVAGGIVQAAVGLRSRGLCVVLARDAALDLGDELAPMAYRRMEAKGVVFADTAEIVQPRKQLHKVPFRTQVHAAG